MIDLLFVALYEIHFSLPLFLRPILLVMSVSWFTCRISNFASLDLRVVILLSKHGEYVLLLNLTTMIVSLVHIEEYYCNRLTQ